MYSYIISPFSAACNFVGGILYVHKTPDNIDIDTDQDKNKDISDADDILIIENNTENNTDDSVTKVISSAHCIEDYIEGYIEGYIEDYREQYKINSYKAVELKKLENFIEYIHEKNMFNKLNKKNKCVQDIKHIIRPTDINHYISIIRNNNIGINDYISTTVESNYNHYINELISKYIFAQIISDIQEVINAVNINENTKLEDIANTIVKVDESNKNLVNNEIFENSDEIYLLNKKYVLYHSHNHVSKNENNSWNYILV